MPKPRRALRAAADETLTPPASLTPTQTLARVAKAEGSNLYTVELPASFVSSSANTKKSSVLVELPSRFVNAVLVRRGAFVLVDLGAEVEERTGGGRVDGEIVNIVRDEKVWRREMYWPAEFKKEVYEDSDDEESTVGKMPPSDSDEE